MHFNRTLNEMATFMNVLRRIFKLDKSVDCHRHVVKKEDTEKMFWSHRLKTGELRNVPLVSVQASAFEHATDFWYVKTYLFHVNASKNNIYICFVLYTFVYHAHYTHCSTHNRMGFPC